MKNKLVTLYRAAIIALMLSSSFYVGITVAYALFRKGQMM